MPTSTVWDRIEAEAARRYAAANAPATVAVRAVGDLSYALERCSDRERADVLALLRDELGLPPACGFAAI